MTWIKSGKHSSALRQLTAQVVGSESVSKTWLDFSRRKAVREAMRRPSTQHIEPHPELDRRLRATDITNFAVGMPSHNPNRRHG